MRWIYAAFWIFVGSALFWQFLNYNSSLDHAQVVAGPTQQHYYFNNHSANTTSLDLPPPPDAANVKQVGFSSTLEKPFPGQFTSHVILKNYGTMKATGVQVLVTPYQIEPSDSDKPPRSIDTVSPLINQWVDFPDMAPGETVTRDVIFMNRSGVTPGNNLHPQIIFHTEKVPVPVAPPPSGPTLPSHL